MPDENNKKEESSTLDKIVMGAIIGTAIGSAIGITLAPKKGEETRKILKESFGGKTSEAKEIVKLSKEILHGLGKIAKRIFLNRRNN